MSGTAGLFTLVTLPPIPSGAGPPEIAAAVTAFTLTRGLGRLVASWAAERARRCRTHTALLTATTLRQSTPAATAPHGPSRP